jgi:hypothetical protein
MRLDSVKINVTLLGRTDLAILVSDGQREAWVPLSQIEEEITEPTGHFGLMTTTAIIVPDWVAREKGLQQVNQDEDTLDLFGGAQ